ncbi:MAG TPA: MFS transporter [Clostridia bacterium]|nr:MFS transporter [Clostridia bacterium]
MKKENQNWKKVFFTIWIGQAFSLIGSSAAQFAIIWWLTVQTGSAMVLAIASIVAFLPQAVIGPFAGVYVDRHSRKTIMIAADLLVASASGVLAASFIFGEPQIWLVYLILFIRAIGSCFHSPAMQAAMPMLVPESELTKVAGWNQLVVSVTAMAGPVLGTMLMTAFSIPAVMAVDIIGAVIAALTVAAVSIPNPEKSEAGQHILKDMLAGINIIKENKPLRIMTIPMMIFVFVYLPVNALFPLMVSIHFKGGAWHASIVEFVFASGLLISSLILGIWGGAKNKPLMVSGSIGILGILLAVSGVLPEQGFPVFVILCGIMGVSGNLISVPYTSFIQETVPPEALGRVFAILGSMMSFATPIGLFIAGPLAEVIGVAQWFLISGLLIFLAGFIGLILSRKL